MRLALALALLLVAAPATAQESRHPTPAYSVSSTTYPGQMLAWFSCSGALFNYYYAGVDNRTLHIYREDKTGRQTLPILLPLAADDTATLYVREVEKAGNLVLRLKKNPDGSLSVAVK